MSLEHDINELKKNFDDHNCDFCGKPNCSKCDYCIGSSGDKEDVLCKSKDGKNLCFMCKRNESVSEAGVEVETEPTIAPSTPSAPPAPRPKKPNTPIRPTPGVQPKPKALNKDVEMFLKKRGLKEVKISNIYLGEAYKEHPDPSGFMRAAHDEKSAILIWWYNIKTAAFIKTTKPDAKHNDDQDFLKRENLADWVRGRVFTFKGKTYLIIYFPEKKRLTSSMLIDIMDNASNSVNVPITKVIDDNGNFIEDMFECQKTYKLERSSLGAWKINESGDVVESERINEQDPLKGVHPQKKEWIETGDENLNKILPELSPEEKRYLVTIASETYQETIQKIQNATGMEVKPTNYPALVGLMFQTLEQTKAIESAHKDRLEDMALDLVFSIPEFKIVEEAYLNDELGFDIKLEDAELGRLTSQEEEQPEEEEEELSQDEELNMDLADAWKDTSDEDIRRRFANLLITGGSYNKLHLYNMAVDRLARLDEHLPAYYGILASLAQLGYWITPFGIEQAAAGGGETSAGSEEVIPKGDKYIIKVRGTTFPYLVYELIKGIYEYLAIDPSQQVAMGKDTLEDETKDMIAGPGVFKAISSYIPADKQELLPIVQKKLTALKADEIKDVISKNSNGQNIMKRFIQDAENELGTYRKEKEEYRA